MRRIRDGMATVGRAGAGTLTAVVLAAALAGCGAAGQGGATGAPTLTAETVPIAPARSAGDLDGGFPALVVPATGGVLRAALAQDVDCWNGLSRAAPAWSVFAFAARGLYGYADGASGGADGTIRPDLADDMPLVAEDGLSMRVRLREGLRFPDGSAVDAGDVVATFERMLDPAAQCAGGGPPASGAYAALAGYPDWAERRRAGEDAGPLPGVRVVDPRTVEFALAAPDPGLTDALALPWAFIRPADAPAARADRGPPPFVGPYRIARLERGTRLVLEREPTWAANVAAGAPEGPWQNALDGVDLAIGVSPERQLAGLESGAFDLSLDRSVPFGRPAARAVRDPVLAGRVFSTPAASVTYLALRADQPPFDRLEARQAVNRAVDRAALARIAGGPAAAAPWGQVLPPTLAVDQPAEVYGHDPPRARALLRAAGRAGATVIVVHGSGPGELALARAVRRDLRRVGLDARLRALPAWSLGAYLRDPATPWHIALVSWTGTAPDAMAWYGPLLVCGAPSNAGRWCDPDFDAHVGEAAALPPGPERSAQLAALSEAVMEEGAPWAPLLAPRRLAVVSPRLLNYRWSPVPGTRLDVAGVVGPRRAPAVDPLPG
ncbi:MAG: ABC transporter substrate-binding protein [Gaiellales bacterium]